MQTDRKIVNHRNSNQNKGVLTMYQKTKLAWLAEKLGASQAVQEQLALCKYPAADILDASMAAYQDITPITMQKIILLRGLTELQMNLHQNGCCEQVFYDADVQWLADGTMRCSLPDYTVDYREAVEQFHQNIGAPCA